MISKIDIYLDYIPVVSTVTNLTTLFYKYFNIPQLDHFKNKKVYRCVVLLLPVIGNLYILFKDYLRARDEEEASDRIRAASKNQQDSLKLDDLSLEKLPAEIWELTNLKTLNLKKNQLTCLPSEIKKLTRLSCLDLRHNLLTALPSEIGLLTNLSHLLLSANQLTFVHSGIFSLTSLFDLQLDWNQLTSLPKEIGKRKALLGLRLNDNKLTSLPDEIGQLTRLASLHLENNKLPSLPSEIGQLTRLHKLYLEGNQLTFLPKEIGRLRVDTLTLHDNLLTTLPEEIGLLTPLKKINLARNRLSSLPPQMESLINLIELKIKNNPTLKELPMSLGQLSGLTDIDISGTGIDRSVVREILNQCRVMRSAQAAVIMPRRLAKWQAMGKCRPIKDTLTDSQKIDVNEWLVRLEKTRDFAHFQASLARIVCSILEDALNNKEFQELFFAQVAVNNACCEDRAAMALNEIYTSWMIMCKKGLPLSTLTGVAKTLCLRKEIAKRLPADEGESVEIFLYYETKLRNELQLVTAITNMAYSTIGKRSWIDEKSLVRDVNLHFFEELFDLPLFQKMIENKWDAEFHQKLEDLGPCPNGSPEDEAVLNYQHCQGMIMTEWRQAKMKKAKEWYHAHVE